MKKKILILLVFALFLSISAMGFSQASADEDGGIITITAPMGYEGNFNSETLEFYAD